MEENDTPVEEESNTQVMEDSDKLAATYMSEVVAKDRNDTL